jgi:hypothetical protein
LVKIVSSALQSKKTGQESEKQTHYGTNFQLIVNAPFYLVALCLLVGLAYALFVVL